MNTSIKTGAVTVSVMILIATAGGMSADMWLPETAVPVTPGPVITVVPSAGPLGPGYYFPPCETEDSPNCYWDGGSNGQGRPFIDINGTAVYLGES